MEIEVGGVGFKVGVGRRLWQECRQGEKKRLYCRMVVSEREMSLWGFGQREEAEMFDLLLAVPGVGPRIAIQVLGESGVREVMAAVAEADIEFFKRVKGVGRKAAQKIIIELKSKVGGREDVDLAGEVVRDEVWQSLRSLGFLPGEIDKVMGKLPKGLSGVEERLGWCLKNLG